MAEGEQKAGAAVTTEDKVIWAKALPAGSSAQRAELIALTQALKMTKAIQKVTESYKACAQVNLGRTMIGQGVRPRGHRPNIHWEIDFTEIKPGIYGYKYLLVFVDTFSGWVEAFPTKHETTKMVTKKLLEEIFPRYDMPQALGSDNGSAFVSQVSQLVAKLLGID